MAFVFNQVIIAGRVLEFDIDGSMIMPHDVFTLYALQPPDLADNRIILFKFNPEPAMISIKFTDSIEASICHHAMMLAIELWNHEEYFRKTMPPVILPPRSVDTDGYDQEKRFDHAKVKSTIAVSFKAPRSMNNSPSKPLSVGNPNDDEALRRSKQSSPKSVFVTPPGRNPRSVAVVSEPSKPAFRQASFKPSLDKPQTDRIIARNLTSNSLELPPPPPPNEPPATGYNMANGTSYLRRRSSLSDQVVAIPPPPPPFENSNYGGSNTHSSISGTGAPAPLDIPNNEPVKVRFRRSPSKDDLFANFGLNQIRDLNDQYGMNVASSTNLLSPYVASRARTPSSHAKFIPNRENSISFYGSINSVNSAAKRVVSSEYESTAEKKNDTIYVHHTHHHYLIGGDQKEDFLGSNTFVEAASRKSLGNIALFDSLLRVDAALVNVGVLMFSPTKPTRDDLVCLLSLSKEATLDAVRNQILVKANQKWNEILNATKFRFIVNKAPIDFGLEPMITIADACNGGILLIIFDS